MALRANGETIRELCVQAPEGFAHVLFDALQELRQATQIELQEIDCFAAASGPGSFTGVRVALAAAKGLAEAFGKSAAGISNLRALSALGKTDRPRAVSLDARRGEVYSAIYDARLHLTGAESVGLLESFRAELDPAIQYEFLTQEDATCLAGAVALCAELDGAEGKWNDPAELDANYVRRSDAELFWRDR